MGTYFFVSKIFFLMDFLGFEQSCKLTWKGGTIDYG